MFCAAVAPKVGLCLPEHCLCLAVLERALLDLKMEDSNIRKPAAQWIFSDEDHLHSFVRILHALGIESRIIDIRTRAKDLLKEGKEKERMCYRGLKN